MQRLGRSAAGAIVMIISVCAQLGPAASQVPAEPHAAPALDLQALARQMPDCKEFRNSCRVCLRQPDGTLGCSNTGVACTPDGPWRCATPANPDQKPK
jgi:hypothetical protein